MATENRYSPPAATVDDVIDTDEVQPVKIWSSQGRIGRLRFLAYSFAGYMMIALLGGLFAGILGALLGRAAALVILPILLYIAVAAFGFLQAIKRSHDMNWNGWTCLLTLVPFVGLIWVFKAGTPGSNDYGAPPPPNTLGVKILGFLMPALCIIGIVAAIALPAYQQYVMRARGH